MDIRNVLQKLDNLAVNNKLYCKTITNEDDLIQHVKVVSESLKVDRPINHRNRHPVVCSSIFALARASLNEGHTPAFVKSARQLIQTIQNLDEYSQLPIQIGTQVAIINYQLQGDSIELWGFTNPKTITKITRDPADQSIKQFEFNNDPDDVWPRADNAQYQGQFVTNSAFFGSKQSAEHAVTMILTARPEDLEIRNHISESVTEGKALARPRMPGAGIKPDTPKDVAKKTKKLDLFKALDEELKETAVLRRISQKFEDFKHNLEEYGGYAGSTGATAQPQTDGNLSDEQKEKAAEIQQTQKTLQSIKPQLQQAGAQNIDVNQMTAALTKVDDQPGKQVTGQAAQQLNKLAPGVVDALKNPQSAQMLKTALQKGEQAAQQAQAQKRT